MAADRDEGPATNRHNEAVKDPSPNVLDLVEVAMKRQDDLREMSIGHVERMAALREKCAEELRTKESDRLDAIRAVDVAAVQRAAEVAADAVNKLAAQVPVLADTVRQSLEAALSPIKNDIGDLRRTQYEQQGSKAQTAEGRADTESRNTFRFALIGASIAAVGLFLSIAAVVVTLVLAGGGK